MKPDTGEQLATNLHSAAQDLKRAQAAFHSSVYVAVRSGWSRREIATAMGVGIAWLRARLNEPEP